MADADRLLKGLRAGDEEAFTALVRRHHASLVGVAIGFVGSRATAEEVVQDTWLAVIEGLERFEGRSSLTTWIYSILANKARTRAVRDKRSVPLDVVGAGEDERGPAADPSRFDSKGRWSQPPALVEDITPVRVVAGRQLWAHVREEMERLPARQRSVVMLRDVEHMAASDVARILDISEANQRVLLHRGRARLRQFIEDLAGE